MNQKDIKIPAEYQRNFNNNLAVPVVVSKDWHVEKGNTVRCQNNGPKTYAKVTEVEQAGSRTKVWLQKLH